MKRIRTLCLRHNNSDKWFRQRSYNLVSYLWIPRFQSQVPQLTYLDVTSRSQWVGEPDYKSVAYHFQLVTPVASEVDPGQLCWERVPVARLNELCGKDLVMVLKMMMVMRRRRRRKRMRMTKVFPGVPRRPAATEVVQVNGQYVKVCVLPFFS